MAQPCFDGRRGLQSTVPATCRMVTRTPEDKDFLAPSCMRTRRGRGSKPTAPSLLLLPAERRLRRSHRTVEIGLRLDEHLVGAGRAVHVELDLGVAVLVRVVELDR